jgi:hypothetical protein
MKIKIILIRNIIGVNLVISIMASSFGREIFIQEYVNYYFWLSLGLSLGFGLLSILIRFNQKSIL